MTKLVIQIPCLNESQTLPQTLSFVHPTFAAIAEGGSFRVDGLPAGTLRLEPSWYEGREQRLGQPVEIEIEAGRELRREIRLIVR